MGKKEKDIKRQNDEFYKQYNYIRDDKKERLIEDENQKAENKDNRIESEFERMIIHMKLALLEYVDHQGLPLCETLDDTNLENYVTHVLNGCPRAIRVTEDDEVAEADKPTKPTKSSPEELCKTIVEIEELQEEIDMVVTDTVRKLGENDIFNEYIKNTYPDDPNKIFEEQTLYPVLRKRLIKLSGSVEKYNNWVNRLGVYEYENIKQKMKL
jgi:hypothetical protein